MSSTMASVKQEQLEPRRRALTEQRDEPHDDRDVGRHRDPHPSDPAPPPTIAAYTRAGTTIPPMAAMIGNAARRRSWSSPGTSSRLISSPTTKKNSTIAASLIQPCRSSANTWSPIVIAASVVQRSTYESYQRELAQTMAIAAAMTISSPAAASSWRKSLRGRIRRSFRLLVRGGHIAVVRRRHSIKYRELRRPVSHGVRRRAENGGRLDRRVGPTRSRRRSKAALISAPTA